MGMFDSLYLEGQKCAKCGAELDKEWQTKSMFNELRVFKSKEEVQRIIDVAFNGSAEFHNYCPNCFRCNYIFYENGWMPIEYDKERERYTKKTIEETKKRQEQELLDTEKEINRRIAGKQFNEAANRQWRINYADKF